MDPKPSDFYKEKERDFPKNGNPICHRMLGHTVMTHYVYWYSSSYKYPINLSIQFSKSYIDSLKKWFR